MPIHETHPAVFRARQSLAADANTVLMVATDGDGVRAAEAWEAYLRAAAAHGRNLTAGVSRSNRQDLWFTIPFIAVGIAAVEWIGVLHWGADVIVALTLLPLIGAIGGLILRALWGAFLPAPGKDPAKHFRWVAEQNWRQSGATVMDRPDARVLISPVREHAPADSSGQQLVAWIDATVRERWARNQLRQAYEVHYWHPDRYAPSPHPIPHDPNPWMPPEDIPALEDLYRTAWRGYTATAEQLGFSPGLPEPIGPRPAP